MVLRSTCAKWQQAYKFSQSSCLRLLHLQKGTAQNERMHSTQGACAAVLAPVDPDCLFGLHIGAAAVEVAYSDLESVLKELQALHQQADAAHEQATSNSASQASSDSFRRQQERNAAIEKIHAVLPFLEAQLVDAAHDDPSRLIVPVVMLPLIQERLSDEAAQHAERTAQKAFDDLLQDEVRIDCIPLVFNENFSC